MKVCNILKSNNDIYCLQDLRLLNTDNQKIFKKELECTAQGSYDSYINSTLSKRGTAILIKRNLDYKIFREFHSTCNNVILLDMTLNNVRLSILSVYAPPQNINYDFFLSLKNKIVEIGNPFILLGDLNSIPTNIQPSPIPSHSNLDTYKMSQLPNPHHSKILNEWISSDFCIDLFRVINPNKKQFSYVPFAKNNVNRSRIDHALISPCLINEFNYCDYLDNKISIFDHKLLIAKCIKKSQPYNPSIDPNLLDLPGLFDTVKFAFYELILESYNLENHEILLNALQTINLLSKEIVFLKDSQFKSDAFVDIWIKSKESKLRTLCALFPDINDCYSRVCQYDPGKFLELILNTLKNSIISFQSSFRKELNTEKKNISYELNNLKAKNSLSEIDLENIYALELKLSSIEDNELLRSIESAKYFNILNNEKGSMAYSKLLKNSKKTDIFSSLTDDKNLPFKNNVLRNEHIKNHFSKKFGTAYSPSISIDNFFGEFSDHPLLQDFKLNEEDKVELGRPITLIELDKSLTSSNLNSACGADGIHIKAISKFWEFLRIPFLNGFNHMIEEQKLSPIMRCSKITLIPKNGISDPTDLTQVRPVAVLCSPYKLFSGIQSNRLKPVLDKISYKAQKAYSSRFCINESLLITYELMAKSIISKSSLCVMSVDFSSAFDAISIDFITEALRFFNFPDYFINLFLTSMKDRYGVVVTDDGITETFRILIGIIQGDRPSCDYFKLGLTILILYFVISNKITLPPNLPFKLNVGDPIADILGAFADDLNFFFSTDVLSLQFCKETLDKFKELSGLSINSKKTKICISGSPANNDFINKANSYNFEIVDSFKLLGITFDKDLKNMDDNWNKCYEKMVSIRNFWSLFHLSVPGKINIIKTFILPQINYVGSILTPPNDLVERMEDLIFNFLNQNIRVAKCKIFSPLEAGGLGIPNIRIFLKSLDLLLFRKSIFIKDAWTSELHNSALSISDIFYYTNNIDLSTNPILHRLINTYMDFSSKFWVENNNIRDLRIFDSEFFCNSQGLKVSRAIFTNTTWERWGNEIKCLKFDDIISIENKCFGFEEFKNSTSINISFMEFFRLNSIIRYNIEKYSTKFDSKQQKIETFFKKKNLKSKHFRPFLISKKFEIEKIKTTENRYFWSSTILIDKERELLWQRNWSHSFMTIESKDFAFKMLNNQIKLNAHISHFDENISPSCTFCTVSRNLPAEKETIKHFFIDCPSTNFLCNSYFSKLLRNKNCVFNNNWLLIGAPRTLYKNLSFVINIQLILMCLFLFKCRNKNQLPLEKNWEYFLTWHNTLFARSKKYSENLSLFSNPFDPG